VDADRRWRQQRTERWLQQAVANQAEALETGICGGAILGEIVACPSASEIDRLAICLLDCDDVVRIDRLRSRGTHGATIETLCWAAWQRVHIVDPQWRQDVITDDANEEMRWERWTDLQRGDSRWPPAFRLDTTSLDIEGVAREISRWIGRERAAKPNLNRRH
jgi:hypothetical protein